ncbi:hypothetical protein [Burkholderia cepacia]|uniref:hypothetical protein n=1 Tax=Burkholderia cepacia TaxID=292 RepID=UPI0012D986E7|nr:hypothetical protein [Burkholderia cepacia]
MMGGVVTAIVSACFTLLGGYVTVFVAERYRRYLDAQALAFSLFAEIKALANGVVWEIDLHKKLASDADSPTGQIWLWAMPLRKLAVYESSLSKLGMLGEVSGSVVTTYTKMQDYDSAMFVLASNYKNGMEKEEIVSRLEALVRMATSLAQSANIALNELDKFSKRRFSLVSAELRYGIG